MPYSIEQICLKVIHKAQNNAKDSKGQKHGHEHMKQVCFMEITVFCKVNIISDCIIDNQSAINCIPIINSDFLPDTQRRVHCSHTTTTIWVSSLIPVLR